jgi:hypothetical protein
MDSKKVKTRLKKYWEGKSSLNEENELKSYFLHSPDGADPDHEYFTYLNKKSSQNPLDHRFDDEILKLIVTNKQSRKLKNNVIKYWYIAASLALVISVSIIFNNEYIKVNKVENVVEMDTYEDPEKAFEETKRTLLLLSSKLNQSGVYAIQFSKFEESQNNLKQN